MGKRQTHTPHVQENVLRYLQNNPGRRVTAMELSDELGLDRTKVLNAARLLADKEFINKTGTMFAYVGEQQNGGNPLFELLATSSNGDLVLQKDDGTVIIARPTT